MEAVYLDSLTESLAAEGVAACDELSSGMDLAR